LRGDFAVELAASAHGSGAADRASGNDRRRSTTLGRIATATGGDLFTSHASFVAWQSLAIKSLSTEQPTLPGNDHCLKLLGNRNAAKNNQCGQSTSNPYNHFAHVQ